MTVAVNFSTVTNSIAALSISGVTVKDIDEITSSRMGQKAIFAPRPENFVTGLSVTAETFGSGATRTATLAYTLNYVYYHCPLPSTLNFADYANVITNVAAILVALITNDTLTGAADVGVGGVSDLGAVSDPAGNMFFGCVISIRVEEYIN